MSLKRAPSLMSHYEEEGSGFGCHAPIMVPDQSVSMCQLCSKMFTLTFRRHHCRACGRVVCGDCSRFKLYLQYMQKKERACQECYKEWKISSTDENDGPTPDSPAMETRKLDAPAVLIIDSREKESDTVMEGYVMVLEGKKWVRYWYMLMKDLAIYKFKAHEDIRAIETIPLPGYCLQSNKDSCIINLKHPSAKKKFNFTFKSDSVEEFDAWVDTLEKVIRLEIPDPIRRDSQSHLVPTSPNDRYRSQSLCLLDDAVEDEQVELEKSI